MSRISLFIAALALSFAACTWEPVTRPVQPELVLSGVMRVDRALDWEARRVLVEETIGEAQRFHLVDTETMTTCVLPEGRPVPRQLRAPNLSGKDVPRLLLPLRRQIGEVEVLYLVNEKCAERGPYGELHPRREPEVLPLRADGREVLIVSDPSRALRLFDPWTEETFAIAADVDGWSPVLRPESGARAPEPEALWLLEGGHLKQRALDGALLLDMGTDVAVFTQRIAPDGARLRVAYQDGTEVYEALSPDYAPVRIASDACAPAYVGDALELFTPCESEQLVRVEGATVRFFPPGVFRVFPQGDLSIQLARNDAREQEVWIAFASGTRTKLTPTPAGGFPITVLDSSRIAGRADDDAGSFGVWSLVEGFRPVIGGVAQLTAYRLQRTSQHLWLMFHDVNGGVGRLSTVEERAVRNTLETGVPLVFETVAEGVPLGGYRGYQAPFLSEQIVLTYEQSRITEDGSRFVGSLHARLLTGRLGARIDDDVSSSILVVAPLPGVLYAIAEGPRAGLWFAAL